MIRRLLKHPGLKRALARLLGLYLSLTYRTIRWQVDGVEHIQPLLRTATPFIVGVWHERLALTPRLWGKIRHHVPAELVDGYRPCALASRNHDGEVARLGYERFGFISVRGSSSKGGAAGLRALVDAMKDGHITIITPDGPRGPRRQAAPGIIKVAELTGAPIFASAGSVSHAVVLKSWDRMMFPLPFCRGALVVLPVTDHSIPTINATLTEVCDRADRMVGRVPG